MKVLAVIIMFCILALIYCLIAGTGNIEWESLATGFFLMGIIIMSGKR